LAGFVASHSEKRLPGPNESGQGKQLLQSAEVILGPKIVEVTRDLRKSWLRTLEHAIDAAIDPDEPVNDHSGEP
jgi:hypothetical protein